MDYSASEDEREDVENVENEEDHGYRQEEPYDWQEVYLEEQVDDDDFDWGEEYQG